MEATKPEQVICLKDFKVSSDLDMVMKLIHCQKDSPAYEEMKEAYEELAPEAKALARPVALLRFSHMQPEIATKAYPTGTPVLYVITSIGKSLSNLSAKYFFQGDYVKGMVADAIADTCLFSFGSALQEIIRAECKKRNVGIAKNLQAPLDVSMQAQKVAHTLTEAESLAGIGITSGMMLDPVKSGCTLYVLTEEADSWRAEHDCRKCPRKDCVLRRLPPVPVMVVTEKGSQIVNVREGQNLLEAMVQAGLFVQSPCGGTGKCGKCKVQLVEGSLSVTSVDEKLLSQQELEQGIRLACCAEPQEPCTIRFYENREYQVVSEYTITEEESVSMAGEDSFGIAIDIGTTTIALELVGLQSGATITAVTLQNHQSAYGADVISRIQAANGGKLSALQQCIRSDLLNGIKNLLAKAGVAASDVEKLVISANTTMVHLLMGYSCETLGVAPFTPVDLGPISVSASQLLGIDLLFCPVWIMPGISTYVGGDIVSGLLACDFDHLERPCLFIDLGTNGELAIGNRDGIVSASTAAGPAFEGGNLSCGVGSVEGAVCGVTLHGGKVENLTTIGDGTPCGICGTGVVELLAELRKENLLDETGLLEDAYFEEGFSVAEGETDPVKLTQKDIREVQLAKAAIRAGIETLMEACNVTAEDLESVYVAGGFGYQLNIEKAIQIGLLPEAFKGKVVAVGNSSLGGAALCVKQSENEKRAAFIRGLSKEVSLSGNQRFQELYIDAMFFAQE